ncbi:S8 family serine peptidase [Fulvivirgaceae bacterium PWU4]|uniref:S8 family serine peptidase n=1 Tax=Chryseosolibacter histidini TaxID=2782349 RepID=A0AAP2GPL7_9BACT|nr:S8 family serine peptidase [Chryseosolibacter histidini]MBT1698095.1 S8 family serine peptidase [Chryseosolibacter histidini]
MTKLYKLHVQRFILVSAILFFAITTAWSQNGQAVHEGLVRIKVSETLATTLERSAMVRTAEGVVLTGVPSLDDFNRRFKVTQFRRLFRGAGKFEARHRRHALHRWYEIRIESPIPVLQAVSAYQTLIQVEEAEPVHKKVIVGSEHENFGPVVVTESLSSAAALNGPSNDPMLAEQWHYNNTGQTGGTPGADIRLFDAWQSTTGKKEVIVAVTDGGIQLDHPDLKANLWVNPGEVAANNIDDDNNGFIDDVHGYSFVDDTGAINADDHGTHVAGTIAAVTHNGIGVAGVAGGSGTGDGVRLMSCAVFGYFKADGFPESYVYAADNGAVISQNSWGYISPGVYEQAVLDAIDYFVAEAGQDETGAQTGPMKGGLVVFSAGNSDSQDKYYPGYYASTFAVAATTHKNGKAWYSNYATWVDIAAPGGETDNIESEGVLSTLAGGLYGFFQGTSMACPHVTGAAALVVSKYGKKGFSPEAVRERLRSTASSLDTGNPAYNGKMGSGLLNAGAALRDTDHTAPAAITNLSITDSDIGTETLSWTVPADQGGFVASYDIRYSKTPITASNFSSASAVSDPPASAPAGSKQEFTVTGLSGGTLYYFAVKAIDFEGNRSAISNVISKTTVQAPVIQITPSLLTVDLQTAQKSTRTFTVRNTGPGPLKFRLANAVVENDFAACSPEQGNLAPGSSQVITVTFDAANLLAGTYRKELRVESNDPERSLLIIPLTLRVTNNNAPIASVRPDSIHFNSVQIGTSASKKITLHNAGSDPLVISRAETGSTEFTTGLSRDLSIPAFHDTTITITFSPASPGLKSKRVTLYTNDAAHPTLTIAVAGEGLNEAPVAVTPASIEETIAQGTVSQRTLVLKNNGSFDRNFRIEVVNKGLGSTTIQKEKQRSSTNARAKASEDYQARPAPDPTKVDALLLSQPGLAKTNTQQTDAARQRTGVSTAAVQIDQYATGFENFEARAVNDQEGWYANEGWEVKTARPDHGQKHLRGTAVVGGQTTLAISPTLMPDYMPDEYPQITTVSMRVNFDDIEGAAWQIVPQDHWTYVVTRIQINADRTIDVMSTDENYDILWNRIDAEIPEGYFDLAVEHNSYGDGSSGFPTFDLYVNNKKVFTGYNIGPSINEVAFICTAASAGPMLDIDELDMHVGEHVPGHINPSPVSGVLPAGGSTAIALGIDGTAMRFGTYHSDIVAHIDEASEVTVPATVTVTGEGSLTVSTSQLNATGYRDERITMELDVKNTGGIPFNYKVISDLPGLSATPGGGNISVRSSESIVLEYDASAGGPGFFYDTLKIVTDLDGDLTLEVPVFIRVWEELSIFTAPGRIDMQVQQGEITTQTFEVSNTGRNKVQFAFYMYDDDDAVTIETQQGTLTAGETREIIVTLDATQLREGFGRRHGYFLTNDPAHGYSFLDITFNVLPSTNNGSGSITREEWTNVTGRTVASIPVNTPPTSVIEMTSLEAPYGYGDNYGARLRGYIQPPYSGEYTFWIASDDNSELWLSTDLNPANKAKIAYLNNYVDRGQYEKYPSQKSALIYMEAGRKYYIEVLHKEGTGRDHLTVGWEIPGGRQEFPIPGVRLFPLNFTTPQNSKPVVTITSPAEGADFTAPASVEIAAEVSDDGGVVKVEFYNGNVKLGTDVTAPYFFRWNNVAAGNYDLKVKATDNFGAVDSATVNIVVDGQHCAGTGTIRREVWTGITGTTVSVIPLKDPPSSVSQLSLFESPSNAGDNYGSRIRGYLCVPTTGAYTFWIASDDQSELWLSTDDSPSNKVKIASVTGHTQRRQWDKYTTQKSAAITLQAGYRYYIEALHKEATGTDHLAVGWQLPGGALERPIAGNRLMPFEEIVAPACAGTGTLMWDFWPAIPGTSVSSIPVDNPPALITEITSFETPQYFENNYGARLRGYICVPQTGTYTFWIASDDNSELWLSTDTDRAKRVKIASVSASTRPRQWDKYPSQKSVAINLVAGSRYYIEALHKEANGNDHVAVAWQLPDGTFEGPIPGSRLSPGLDGVAARSAKGDLVMGASEGSGTIGEIGLYPNPAERGSVTLSFSTDADQWSAGAWQVEITSMTGTVVHSEITRCDAGCSAVTIALNERFTPGVYMVNVIIDRKRFSKKLVVR